MKHWLLPAALAAFVSIFSSCTDEEYGTRIQALDESHWDASIWISAQDAEVVTGRIAGKNIRAADGASWFVSTIENEGNVMSAKWMTSALGVYDIYVNSKLIGTEILKPGFTHTGKTKLSFTYDITDAFKCKSGAENVLAAQVTPGWWGDKIVTPNNHEGMVGRKCAFRGIVELTFADGSKKYYGTDLENWKAGIAGPVKHAAIFDGEFYDARELPGYETPEKLSTPEENTEFLGNIFPSEGAEVYRREDLTLQPVRAYTWKDIEGASEDAYGTVVIAKEFAPGEPIEIEEGETLVIDFGQNAAAVPAFVFKADEGTVLTCLPSEIMNDGNGAHSRGMDGPEGSCHRLNLRTPEDGMILEYTFGKSNGYVDYSPRCTFYGYRYVSITATDNVKFRSIVSVPVTSIAKDLETGTITTGNELINKLISNTLWGMYSNYLSVPTDCPQRNERLGWTADTQVFTETGTFFANTNSFMHKWMRDMRDSQSDKGGFPGVAPYAQYGNDMMRLGWADAGVIVPWTIWKQHGDTGMIEENWDAMVRFMNHIDETKYDHTVLKAENHNSQWADWLSYEALESRSGRGFTGNDRKKGSPLDETVQYWNYLSLSYWVIDAGMMAEMATATGRDPEPFKDMAEEARQIIFRDHLNADGTFKNQILNTMQTPALFALKNNLVDGQAKDNMIARLRENFKQHDNCLQTGFLGTSILMPVLTENGMADIAYELLFQRKNPSWLYSIDNGATTIWERWNSYMIETGMGPKGMNSFNHYAYGCVCEWIWETAAGISCDSSQPGFKNIVMKPIPDKRLGFVKAEYKSPYGLIKSEWRYEGDKWIWDFTIPEGATASVTLPGETESKTYTSGTYQSVK
ncbi:MAG: family 78 glycoside hydrolase catalytic domain [Bacteroidales bacterium]|nr:family 78 glycoside hydrolase catalytic domain [Bacteroidales bacterium]